MCNTWTNSASWSQWLVLVSVHTDGQWYEITRYLSHNHSIWIQWASSELIAAPAVASVTTQVIEYILPAAETAGVCTRVKARCFRAVGLHAHTHSIVQPTATTVCMHWLSHDTYTQQWTRLMWSYSLYITFPQVYFSLTQISVHIRNRESHT